MRDDQQEEGHVRFQFCASVGLARLCSGFGLGAGLISGLTNGMRYVDYFGCLSASRGGDVGVLNHSSMFTLDIPPFTSFT
tara:strand:+ start:4820 stop:5059 length:240 start_codon:yes stop_codon:yes gene_type:complete